MIINVFKFNKLHVHGSHNLFKLAENCNENSVNHLGL